MSASLCSNGSYPNPTIRTQSVSVGDINSSSLLLKNGVLQGSVLEPILLPCTLDLFLIKLESTIWVFHTFAGYTQLYKASQPAELQCLASDLKSCFLSVKDWILINKFKLSDEKT